MNRIKVYIYREKRLSTNFDFSDDFPGGFELLKGLPGRDRVDHDKGVALGNVEPLHGRELVRPCRVGDLEGADGILVARYHLSAAIKWRQG